MIVGFDLDGVVFNLDIVALEAIRGIKDPEARLHEEKLYYLSRQVILDPRKFMHPSDQAVIVTARPRRVMKATFYSLNHNFPGLVLRLPILHVESFSTVELGPDAWANVRTKEDAVNLMKLTAHAKGAALKSVDAALYFEDNGEVIEELRRIMPGLTAIHFGNRFAAEEMK